MKLNLSDVFTNTRIFLFIAAVSLYRLRRKILRPIYWTILSTLVGNVRCRAASCHEAMLDKMSNSTTLNRDIVWEPLAPEANLQKNRSSPKSCFATEQKYFELCNAHEYNKDFRKRITVSRYYKRKDDYLKHEQSPCSASEETAESNDLVTVLQAKSTSIKLWLHFCAISSRPESFVRVT